MELRLSWNYSEVRRAAARIRAFLGSQRIPEMDIWACELAFVEACNNTVRHTPAAEQRGEIHVEVACGGGSVEVRIDDHTSGFPLPRNPVLPVSEQESGRGLYLMMSLMDGVGYVPRGAGNCLVLQRKLAGL
jgi:anti-sigma regulatory factor (Ser/Thr protein kinase)